MEVGETISGNELETDEVITDEESEEEVSADAPVSEEDSWNFDSTVSAGESYNPVAFEVVESADVLPAVQQLHEEVQSGFLAIAILLGLIAGILLIQCFWIGKD